MNKKLLILLTPFILTGCMIGKFIKTDYMPSNSSLVGSGAGVSVQVSDNRKFVVDGSKQNFYIGHYRGLEGQLFDVSTFEKVPFKDVIKTDLLEDLHSMGFTHSELGNKLSVNIIDWNFEGFKYHSKFWYEIKIDVLKKDGSLIATQTLKEHVPITLDGSGYTNTTFEKEIPEQYNAIIANIVRNNADILQALMSH
jgi:uncharacterized lipoprotein YajG